jgi:predicted nucleotidyltransferase
VLFGSWARGQARPESHIDVLVVIRGLPDDRLERHRALYRLPGEVSETFGAAVSAIVLTPEEARRWL